jgi:adenosylcobinamide-phosphate synthase
MGLTALAAVTVAAGLDATVAELPSRVHPVALFGRVVGRFDREWSRPRAIGVAVAVSLPLAAAGVALGVVAAAGRVAAVVLGGGVAPAVATAAVAGLVLFATTSLRMLVGAAREVVAASESDPEAARAASLALVGRDTASLSAGRLRSAAVESAAENLADGLVAPLLAFVVGTQVSVVVGVACAAWVKAVNTLDSMLGYPDRPHGTASARLDDAVMWIPARLSAVLLALAARSPTALTTARRWARAPASPNSGWPMATTAAVLDARLAKPGAYDLNTDAPLPSLATAQAGVRTVSVAGWLAFLLAGVAAWL